MSRMVVISNSTTNEWPPQSTGIDEKDLILASTGRLMEIPGGQADQQPQPQPQQQQQQQQQQALKCPRCDSSNTKFCYYNNYSLSQPRHFCKACKRYWTRGGTLRNVPVGGGCRKNKRVKRPAAAASASASPASGGGANPNPPPISQSHQIDVVSKYSSSSTGHHNNINPFFYGLGNNNPASDINLPFPARFNSRDYDLQPQLSALGLGFSSDGFNAKPNQQQDVAVTSNPLILSSSYSNNIFGSSSSCSTTPTIASLLASTFHQHKFMNGGQAPANHFQGLTSNFQDLQNGLTMKDHVVKAEEAQSRMEWNQLEQIGLSDPHAVYNWNATWHDPPNIGSSVTSLI